MFNLQKKKKTDTKHAKNEVAEKQPRGDNHTEIKIKPSADIMGKLTSVMKKSAEVKEKFFDYIVNPSQNPSQTAPLGEYSFSAFLIFIKKKNQLLCAEV